ncbi:hypothetical protein [Nocardia alni]|uniref:hypothetical protein n=1 Tax=Nocardia alni TaxID=2815723 RepID=UPI001C219B83|nr:hypothetical protein [Nocardia alni]
MRLLNDDMLNQISDQDGLAEKLNALNVASGAAVTAESALVQMAVVWRNKIIHSRARSKLEPRWQKILRDAKPYIQERYSGLDIDRTLSSMANNQAPRFKEVTAFVRASQTFVQQIDEKLTEAADLELYLTDALKEYVGGTPGVAPLSRAQNLWGKDRGHRVNSFIQVATSMGMSMDSNASGISSVDIDKMLEWTPRQAVKNLFPEID